MALPPLPRPPPWIHLILLLVHLFCGVKTDFLKNCPDYKPNLCKDVNFFGVIQDFNQFTDCYSDDQVRVCVCVCVCECVCVCLPKSVHA